MKFKGKTSFRFEVSEQVRIINDFVQSGMLL